MKHGKKYVEAAKLDGIGHFQIFWRIFIRFSFTYRKEF